MFWKIQDRRQIKNTETHKLSTIQKKQTMQNAAKQNYPDSINNTQPGNELDLFSILNAPEPTVATTDTTIYVSSNCLLT